MDVPQWCMVLQVAAMCFALPCQALLSYAVLVVEFFTYRASTDEAMTKRYLIRTVLLVFAPDEMGFSVNAVLNRTKITSVALQTGKTFMTACRLLCGFIAHTEAHLALRISSRSGK